jgi:glycosyltransferase involved in cell wall biosynthesis
MVDVWLPVYNARTTLATTLDSLLRQSYSAFRIIAVDDGSTDGSSDILAAFAKRDSRVVVESCEHCGLVPALQACAARSAAPFVARADADDIYLRHRLAMQIARAQATDAPALVGTGVRQFPQKLIGAGMRLYTAWVNNLASPEAHRRDRLIECPIVHSTFFFRREAYDAVGGYRETSGPEDFDLLLRFVEAGEQLASVPDVLTLWRLDEQSLQRTDPRYAAEGFLQTKLDHLQRLGLQGDRDLVIWGQTHAGKWLAREIQGSGRTVACFVDLDSRKIGRHAYGIPVVDARAYVPDVGRFHINMVRHADARVFFRNALTAVGLVEWEDFVVMQ